MWQNNGNHTTGKFPEKFCAKLDDIIIPYVTAGSFCKPAIEHNLRAIEFYQRRENLAIFLPVGFRYILKLF